MSAMRPLEHCVVRPLRCMLRFRLRRQRLVVRVVRRRGPAATGLVEVRKPVALRTQSVLFSAPAKATDTPTHNERS